MIQAVTLGVALAESDHGVHEEGGDNRGPRVRAYLKNAGVSEGLAWCAAFVQYVSDVAAAGLGRTNPLDEVRDEALVQSYYDALEGSVIPLADVEPGDLVLFKFSGSETWNHMGIVAMPPRGGGMFMSVEGNTSGEGEGEGVFLKTRQTNKYPVCFIRWDGRATE